MPQPTLEDYRAVQKKLWDAGNYDNVAKRFTWAQGPVVIAAAAVSAGDDVADIACGSGNVAIPAAQAGANVTALDITPELLDAARENAAEAGVEIDFVEGDAAELPFADASFDVVTSVFGVQFAPRQSEVAAEIGRILRPGGRIALINWTPAGFIGQVLKTLSSHMPTPPDFVKPPPTWGVPEHVAELFDGTGIKLDNTTGNAQFSDSSSEGFLDFMTTYYGPTLIAKARLSEAGSWQDVQSELTDLADKFNSSDSGFEVASEYLLTTGIKTG